MKVLFHCWEFPPRGSGIGAYIAQMGLALKSAGHESVIVTSSGNSLPEKEETPSGTVYRTYRYEDIGRPSIVDRVLSVVRAEKADIIEGVDHLGESAGVLKARNRPPVVIKCHYNDVLKRMRYAQVYYSWQKFTIYAACLRQHNRIADEKYSISRADALMFPAARLRDEFQADELAIPRKITIIPNAYTTTSVSIANEASIPTVLLAGRIDIGKGIQYLDRLIALLAAEYPDFVLEIAGDDSYARFIGSMREWLLSRCGALASHIRFLGKLDRAGMAEAFHRAWVVIVPSRWDTFPTVVLEAMSTGKAIVASANGGMPEMLAGTENLVRDPAGREFADGVISFLSDREFRKKAGISGKKKILEHYVPAVVVQQYLSFFSSLL